MAELLVGSEAFWLNEQDEMLSVVYPEIQAAVDEGVLAAGEAIQAAKFGVDFAVVNESARLFAQQYSFALVTQINGSTVKALQSFVDNWIASGQPLHELTNTLATDPLTSAMFGRQRARLIAITETTRAYAEGNMLMWAKSGYVIGTTWHTVRDNDVDALCQMNEQAGVVPLGQDYPSGHKAPGAHPGCRCYLSPVMGPSKPPQSFRTFDSVTEAHFWATQQWRKDAIERAWAEQEAGGAYEAALSNYRQDLYGPLNGALRAGETHEWVYELDQAVKTFPVPENVVSFRGMNLEALGVASPDELAVGQTFTDLGFTSTSFDPTRAGKFASFTPNGVIIEIRVPANTSAIYMDSIFSEWENELLLGRGNTFRIVESGGTREIILGGESRRIPNIVVDIIAPKALFKQQHQLQSKQRPDRYNYWVWEPGQLQHG